MNEEFNDLDAIYGGYPTEENYRKNLVANIKKTKYENMKEVSIKLEYSLSPYDIIRLSKEYKKHNKEFNDKVEYLLTDLNFHSECSRLYYNEEDKLIEESKQEIKKLLEHYVLDKFINKYKRNPKNQGYLSLTSKELEDVSIYDCKYLESIGCLQEAREGYKISDNYIKSINTNQKEEDFLMK